MKRTLTLIHEFVEYIPEDIENGKLYISIPFKIAIHKCCCGCGKEVVTPLSPTGWELTFNGEAISLYPSIGNWSFECQSHYWIRHNHVKWSYQFSNGEIAISRDRDQRLREDYFSQRQSTQKHVIKSKKKSRKKLAGNE
jgi:hypothetical protein